MNTINIPKQLVHAAKNELTALAGRGMDFGWHS